MGDNTGIEWTDATWNPVVGCKAVSEGCDHCYAATLTSGRLAGVPVYAGLAKNGVFTGEVRCLPERLDQPKRWKRPRRIFVNSMSDLFHVDIPSDFRTSVFDVMRDAPQHQFQVLTKRPQLMSKWTWEYYDCDHGGSPVGECRYCAPYANVWLGTSIEQNKYAFRANHLREAKAAVRFLSLEPLLGPLPDLDLTDIDWVIVGGESGRGSRPMHPEWARDLRDRCVEAKVPFLFKQWGNWAALGPTFPEARQHPLWNGNGTIVESWHRGPCEVMADVGKKPAGRHLDGRTWDEYPDAV